VSPDLAGNDPYDALRGTRVPRIVKRNQRLRQIVTQIRKRSRVDLAGVLGVAPFIMAKSVAGFLAGHSRSCAASHEAVLGEGAARSLVSVLLNAQGNLGDGAWGYEFDVQTRWAYYPAGSANLIATVFVGNALLEAGLVFGNQDWLDRAVQAAHCLQERFLRPLGPNGDDVFCYTEQTDRLVHNANLLGAGLVATVGSLTSNDRSVKAALGAARVSALAQAENGRWSYGEGSLLGWADNFHTAYNLRGAVQVLRAHHDVELARSVEKGTYFWADRFFGAHGEPFYYDDGHGPLDVHCGATAVDVAALLALEGYATATIADLCADWMRENLVGADGITKYQIRGGVVDARHFVRWGDSHWAAAQGSLDLLSSGVPHPVSSALASAARRTAP
jgi:hypothetical protein